VLDIGISPPILGGGVLWFTGCYVLVLGLCCGDSIVTAFVGGFVACRLLSGELPVLMNLHLLCFCVLI